MLEIWGVISTVIKPDTIYGLRLEIQPSLSTYTTYTTSSSTAEVKVWLGQGCQGCQGLSTSQLWYAHPRQDQQGVPILRIWQHVSRSHLNTPRQFDLGVEYEAEGVSQNKNEAPSVQPPLFYRLQYCNGHEFVIDGTGRNVWATWPESSDKQLAMAYLLGPVLAFVLRLRGVLSLHASAVAIGSEGLAIAGLSGAGKSTTATCLVKQGHALISEDIAALSEKEGRYWVQPGYPGLRLWPDAIQALHDSKMNGLPYVHQDTTKRYLDLRQKNLPFQTEPQPLRAIYLLNQRKPELKAPLIRSMSARDALMALVLQTRQNTWLTKTQRAHEFAALARLINVVPVREVLAPDNLALLPQLAQAIQADFETQHKA